uniref:Uncharacterized protein n=1 Tax=Arundo donax TaxID=35708 RepID=A0A0A8XV73_ARUDO
MSAKSGLVNIIRVHPNLMISETQIQRSEELCTSQFIKQLLSHRNRKFIFDSSHSTYENLHKNANSRPVS